MGLRPTIRGDACSECLLGKRRIDTINDWPLWRHQLYCIRYLGRHAQLVANACAAYKGAGKLLSCYSEMARMDIYGLRIYMCITTISMQEAFHLQRVTKMSFVFLSITVFSIRRYEEHKARLIQITSFGRKHHIVRLHSKDAVHSDL